MTTSPEPRSRPFSRKNPKVTRISSVDTDGVFGRVMGLAAVTSGTFALGIYVGDDLSGALGIGLLVAAIVGLLCLDEVSHQLRPTPASEFLLMLGLLLGLGLGAVLSAYANADMAVVWQSAGGSAGAVAVAAGGYAGRRNLSRLARGAFGVLLLLILLGVGTLVVSVRGAHLVYVLVGPFVFAGYAVLKFRLLRRVGLTETVPLAARIFVDVFDVVRVVRLLRR